MNEIAAKLQELDLQARKTLVEYLTAVKNNDGEARARLRNEMHSCLDQQLDLIREATLIGDFDETNFKFGH